MYMHRWFNTEWRAFELKPVERRTLKMPTSNMSCGKARVYVCTCRVHTHGHARAHVCTCTRRHVPARVSDGHACDRDHRHANAAWPCRCTCAQVELWVEMHIHRHTCTHTCIHTHIHTHTHITGRAVGRDPHAQRGQRGADAPLRAPIQPLGRLYTP